MAAAILAAGALALTACSSGGATPKEGAGGDRGDITIWYSNNEAEITWGKQMVKAWNADHPDEQVKAQEIPAGKSSEEVIGAAITAGNAPCLVFNTAPVAVPQFQKQGGLVSLSSFEGGDDYIKERSGDVAAGYASDDGEFYQMPWKANPVMIFYNKDNFKKAGIDPENPPLATYDEFLATSKKLVDAGVSDFAISPSPTGEFYQSWFDFYPMYAAESGGKQLVEDGKSTFDSDAGKAVSEFWRSLYEQKLAGQEQYQGDSFADGKSSMSIAGPWAIQYYGDKVNWGVVPLPTSAGKAADEIYSFSDAKNIGLYSACKNQATAWDVLKFATSEEQDGQLLEITGQMPIRKDLPGTYPDYFKANPAYEQFGSQANRMVEVPNISNSVEAWQAFRDGYSKAVIFGEGDIPSFLKKTASAVDELVSQ